MMLHLDPLKILFLAHLSRRLKGELIVYQSSRRLCVCVSGCVSVDIFKLEYLRNQWANRNDILTVYIVLYYFNNIVEYVHAVIFVLIR